MDSCLETKKNFSEALRSFKKLTISMSSLFGIGGGSGGQGSSGTINSAQVEMAVAEFVSLPIDTWQNTNFTEYRLDMVTDVFNRLVSLATFPTRTDLHCTHLHGLYSA